MIGTKLDRSRFGGSEREVTRRFPNVYGDAAEFGRTRRCHDVNVNGKCLGCINRFVGFIEQGDLHRH
ncbi:MAG: hypothetical protein AMJ69_02715 [Gammaproteobacteria bacterium SG8_47]|nr:MAG: hypothetical protein AMJ69_02715 [Gammaproteobacteria bacterium SG8_47]